MTHRLSVLGMALFFTSGVALAQPQGKRPFAPTSSSSRAVSLGVLLQLRGEQEDRLNRLYDEYAKGRDEQEARFAANHKPRSSSFDERLRRDQLHAQQKIADSLLAKRERALRVLGPVQRAVAGLYAQPALRTSARPLISTIAIARRKFGADAA